MSTKVKNEAKEGIGIWQEWLKTVGEKEDIWLRTQKGREPLKRVKLHGFLGQEAGCCAWCGVSWESAEDEGDEGVYHMWALCLVPWDRKLQRPDMLTLTAGWKTKAAMVEAGKSFRRLGVNPWRCVLAAPGLEQWRW